jgi:hypothetical protein
VKPVSSYRPPRNKKIHFRETEQEALWPGHRQWKMTHPLEEGAE